MRRPLGALLASLLVVTAGFASVGSASIGVHTGPTGALDGPVPAVGDHDASGADHGQGDGSNGSASGKNGDKPGNDQPSNPSDGSGDDPGSGDDSNRSDPGGGSDSGSNEASNATGSGGQGTAPVDAPPTDEHHPSGNASKSGKDTGSEANTSGGPPGDCGPSEPPTTPVAPATNRGPTAACGDGGLATISFAGVDENATALELRVTAWRLLDDATASEPNETGLPPARGSRLRATLNGSFGHFVGFDRVNDRAVLDDDRHVAAAAGHRAPNATAHLIVADERLARTAVADAERVAERLRDRNASFDEATVERELANARRALNHAERDREHSLNPVAAVAHYRRAWEHAQHALDVMDAATAPAVTFANRTDPPHDGPLNYTVQGAVFDVRPWRTGNVTVSVNGVDRTVPVFARNATPGVAAEFAVRVPIEAPVNRVVVTATDSGEVVSNRSDPYEPNEGTATLRLDADGLPDRYEVNRTTTDPLDPDSDAAATGANESGDGTDDGAADLDRDRLPNVQEFRLGTDPLDADTDGDGLTDWFELRFAETDPLTVDTDGDGTADGEEDPDGDGLTNAVEEAFGSDPLRADGDWDGLVDPAERDLGTDPLDADSDDDGLLDGREPEAPFHTDPLDPDTDDDGVLDGDETYTAAVENASVGASVAVTGAGDAAAGMDVERDTEAFLNTSGTRAAGVSSRVRVASAREFESLRVRLAYDQSAVSDGADVAVYRWNRTVQTFVRLESQRDVANDTVSANATQAGTFVAFDVGAWEALFAEPLPARQSVDVDEFSSENVTCEGSGECGVEDGTLSVGSAFLEISASVLAQLIGTLNDQIDTGGGGDDGGGSDDADGDGVSNPDDDCPFEAGDGPDGCPSESDDPSTPTPPPDRDGDGVADPDDECPDDSETTTEPCFVGTAVGATVTLPAGAEEIRIEVDVRADVRESAGYVEVWLDHDGGREVLYAQHGTGGTAGSDFVTFSQDITHLAGETVTLSLEKGGDASGDVDAMRVFLDSDGDGLTDNEEREGFRMGNGETVSTNVHEVDTDDDGLDDSEEVLKRTSWSGLTYFSVLTDPTDPDTDGDGIDDGPEVDGWELHVVKRTVDVDGETYTGAYRWDFNQSGPTIDVDSNPRVEDTDGDGLDDGEEKAETKTNPRKSITYSITREHQAEIVDRLFGNGAFGTIRSLGIASPRPRSSPGDIELTDATDDFDFVRADDDSLVFRALDRNQRTDTWLSNEREIAEGTDPWDPDSDDDGLTDGQEVKWVTERTFLGTISKDLRPGTNASKADTDGDGWWDGWIGVYDVGRTDNVVLYMEHLQTGNGIEGDEIVQEQVETHTWNGEEHSKVHLGELHWGTDPTERTSDADEQTRMDVEVDWIEGRNPFQIQQGGTTLFDAVEANYQLYGIDIRFHRGEELEISELERKCKSTDDSANFLCNIAPNLHPAPKITPDGLNRHEVEKIEDYFHDNDSKMHLLWGTRLEHDSPATAVDIALETMGEKYTDVDGMAFTNGAPRTELWGVVSDNDFGLVIADDNLGGSDGTQSLLMHEFGHALGAGWADDDLIGVYGLGIEHGLEAYSGDTTGRFIGVDETAEVVTRNGDPRWSVMMRGKAVNYGMGSRTRFAFSVEELSTVDFEHVPSKSGD